jgi:dGTPase
VIFELGFVIFGMNLVATQSGKGNSVVTRKKADWEGFLNSARRKSVEKSKRQAKAKPDMQIAKEFRTELERDYDRILFSTPVRRMADKTQVFPLDRNDSVRTRLTHSHEVSNLCRSIGTHLAYSFDDFNESATRRRGIPALLAAIGLAHDLGNPPFGHQGEQAIQDWFRKSRALNGGGLNRVQKLDFLRFEGNAQTFRILTRLQLRNDNFGLDLTYATLAAVLKYPVPANAISDKDDATKKHGFFQSEAQIVREVWQHTGLRKGLRHPLTYLMEACDDIAYAVLDAEDAVKKGLVSFSDLVAYLKHNGGNDKVISQIVKQINEDHENHQTLKLSPSELNDLSMQKFRVHTIAVMVQCAYEAFRSSLIEILKGRFRENLLSKSEASKLTKCLKSFDKAHAYRHKTVLAVEALGYKTIFGLMDLLWRAITERGNPKDPGSSRDTPFLRFAYQRISENYRRIFEDPSNRMPMRYKEAQLLTDMVSGMTDSFAIDLLNDLKRYDNDNCKERDHTEKAR